jgi:hypothetical protein
MTRLLRRQPVINYAHQARGSLRQITKLLKIKNNAQNLSIVFDSQIFTSVTLKKAVVVKAAVVLRLLAVHETETRLNTEILSQCGLFQAS